jgi:hypothetical protein
MKPSRIGLLVVLLALASRAAFADGIDIPDYVSRFGTSNHSTAEICGLVLALAATDYLWNLLVIGLPCLRICAIRRERLLFDIGLITVLEQVVDRLGLVAVRPIGDLLGVDIWSCWSWVLILGILFCSGAANGSFVWFFVRKEWGGSRRAALAMAIGAVIATNPAIMMFLNDAVAGPWLRSGR